MRIGFGFLAAATIAFAPSLVIGQRPKVTPYPPWPWNGEHRYTGGDSLRLGPEIPGLLKSTFAPDLRDPSSAMFTVSLIHYVYSNGAISGHVCGRLYAKNSFGGYVGARLYAVEVSGYANELNHFRPEVALTNPYVDSDTTLTPSAYYGAICSSEAPPPNDSQWVGWISKKEFFISDCLPVRTIPPNERRRFWLAADAVAAGYVRTKIPFC
jgi:hypothetical protein